MEEHKCSFKAEQSGIYDMTPWTIKGMAGLDGMYSYRVEDEPNFVNQIKS